MKIEVVVKNDDGEVIGEYYAENAYPAKVVTATLWGGVLTVTDDASNTFYKKS